MTAQQYCPECHQRIATERFGVRLPPLKAAILDKIKAAGDLGIPSSEIIADLYSDRRSVSAATIKAHVVQINDQLVSTDWRICSDRRRWFLRRDSIVNQGESKCRKTALREPLTLLSK
jgi:hypothetical protein